MKTSSLRLSALNFLAIREHSVLELRQKLKNKLLDSDSFSDAEVEHLLSALIKDNLLSDQRFSEVFIRSRMNKGFGPVKIRYELKAKGVASHIIDKNMQSSELNWFDSIEKAWNKKFADTSYPVNNPLLAVDKKETARQSRYLYQRGFSSDQIETFLADKKDHHDSN